MLASIINKDLSFNETKQSVSVVGTHDEPWFCGKHVAKILGYTNEMKSIRDHVDIENKLSLGNLHEKIGMNKTDPLTHNQKISIYVNEAGLYELIFGSKLPIAKKFKKWVFSEVLPSIRKEGSYQINKQLEESKKIIDEKDKIIQEKENEKNRIHNVNIELLSYKKLNEKNESIYIVATYQYASQGVFKIGRTKNMKTRLYSHNNTHITGDKVKVLKEFKVNDSVLTENYIHKKLKGLLVNGEKEFFMAPYDLLVNIIETIIHNDNEHNELINNIVDMVNKLKYNNYNVEHWMSGIPENSFNEEMKLVVSRVGEDEVKATFNVSNATEEQKKSFVTQCIVAYQEIIEQPQQLVWKTFQAFLISQLAIPKYKYKALQWRARFNSAKLEITTSSEN